MKNETQSTPLRYVHETERSSGGVLLAKENKKISVIVPIYNELKNIESLIVRLSDSLAEIAIPYEIIFIDDNSTDGTYEYLERFSKSKKIVLRKKSGPRGKAFSLMEGFGIAKGTIVAMIDADLQYPPEEIPAMVALLDKVDVVVGERRNYKGSLSRKIISRVFRLFFGRMLFGINCDIQSGLKVFTREVIKTIKFNPSSGWTFDLEFLHRAQEAGFTIAKHEITFSYRKNGNSKVGLVKSTWEIGTNALALRFKRIEPLAIPPKNAVSMIGAGLGYKKRKYITHTTLSHKTSAIETLHFGQKFVIFALLSFILIGIIKEPLPTIIAIIALLSLIYFVDVLFNLYLILKSLHVPQEITTSVLELAAIDDKKLPSYSILCPLYKEAHVVPQFIKAIGNLDWPKSKLDVMVLLEEDDRETIEEVDRMVLPAFVQKIIVPKSLPKTKPKACNFGLGKAKGEYLVIYDAEDIPETTQLKKAYLGFQKVPNDVICLQAKLNYYNPHQNLLTRLFTAEYSLWFDIALTGLQSINTSIPLGGTSNHFKTDDLLKLQGWDPFNVTEDADLGIRLFKKGYKTAMIDSTTLEEANSNLANWMRQRSRWLKGYMQTYFVHMREIFSFARKKGIHALIFQLVIGGKIAFILINPFLWLATFSYFALYAYVGPAIEAVYPTAVFYMAATSLVFGNFLFLYYYMIGCIKREHYSLVKYIFFVPIYWFMISIAATLALYQLVFKPHYWEKTVHGFHIQKNAKRTIAAVFPNPFRQRLVYVSGGLLIAASVAANFLNFLFNAYLGRVLDLASFGLVSLVSSFLYLCQIPFSALNMSVNYRSGFLEGRYGDNTARAFWGWVRQKALFISLVACGLWLAFSPFLMRYFNINHIFPFFVFTLVWFFGFVAAVDTGFLSGRFMFGLLAIVALIDPIIKLAAAYLFVQYDLLPFVYAAIPIAITISFLASAIFANIRKKDESSVSYEAHRFPKKFFISSFLSGLSTITFLSLDIILANHYLIPEDAGRYALISLVGKMIFFLGGLASQFTIPMVARSEGAGKDSDNAFIKILLSTFLLSLVGFLAFGIFGYITVPMLFGGRAESIISYLPLFGFAMLCFTIAKVFVPYYQAKKIYSFSVTAFFLAIIQVVIIGMYHDNILSIVFAMMLIGGLNFISMVALHFGANWVRIFEQSISDLFNLLFEKTDNKAAINKNSLRILIFNWRDTKHVWAGGAETYLHQLAKLWVLDGNRVTMFCGNDGLLPRNHVIDGVRIIRRGGSYMVYIWAFLYYIIHFRRNFDVIIDSENGIPFFTPLYSNKQKFLLIHHVHQEVFRKSLRFPFSWIASFVEAKLMPIVYRNVQVITVSPSSKEEILKHKLTKTDPIIIYNGVDLVKFIPGEKSKTAFILYLGRLQYYKSLHIFIRAARKVLEQIPDVEFVIAGEGGEKNNLQKFAHKLGLLDKIKFLGKVSEIEKIKLYQKAWVFVNPSFMEGWGITTIEANACGTPAVASDVPGLRDSISNPHTGILVKYGDHQAFAESILELIKNKALREKISSQAIKWSNRFTWEKSAEEFSKLIFSAVDKKPDYYFIPTSSSRKRALDPVEGILNQAENDGILGKLNSNL